MLTNHTFKINDFVTLKLENGDTIIYVKGKRFRQCKYLFLLLPSEAIDMEINSIDEASDFYSKEMEPYEGINGEPPQPEEFGLTPEEVFWGHCSNLQAWAEHSYDTRLLHSNLAFPLLKALNDAGDPLARKIYKEEVAKRYAFGGYNVKTFLEEEGYIADLFTEDEAIRIQLTDENYHILRQISAESGTDFRYLSRIRMKTKNLQIIELAEIKGFPDSLRKLKNTLISLNVFNTTGKIPDWIGEFRKLKKLEIFFGKHSGNESELPESIGNLINLEELALVGNIIKSLPSSIGNLKNLKLLKLMQNCLEDLPDSFAHLYELRELNLSTNNIKKFPKCLIALKNLESLNFYSNPLDEVPSWLFRLKSLKSLFLEKNLNNKRDLQLNHQLNIHWS